jgi:Asp-tRNA(Asn)/Glu-tRNA(Gln) amidotransferase A subunit family amidase
MPSDLTALDALAAIRRGDLTSEALVRACLERIAEREKTVQAWTWIDEGRAVEQARRLDEAARRDGPFAPLHGVPVGVKDIIDTADMPTENGTVLHAGRRPMHDAAVVERLRQAGAVILGKTVTTELAVYSPGKTANPHDPRRTPGGSSSGSAAAVACAMVPLAVGTQTNGSVIRPASYCGVVGFKPTHGLISRHGILEQSAPLDQVGVFARTVTDAALIADALVGADARDPDTRAWPRPAMLATALAEPPSPPRFAFVRTPVWSEAADDTRRVFADLVARLGARAEQVELPAAFASAHAWHRTLMEADLARSFAREYETGKERLSTTLGTMIERGQTVRAVDYLTARRSIPTLVALLDEVLDRFDAILTPATTSEAPVGLESTGSPTFCTIWTLCGMPSVTVPVLRGASGMPIGAQVVGRRGDDGRVLRAARWLMTL